MRNVLRAVLAACCVLSFPAVGAETPGDTATPEKATTPSPMKQEFEVDDVGGGGGILDMTREFGAGSGEPLEIAPAEGSGYGADELPSRD